MNNTRQVKFMAKMKLAERTKHFNIQLAGINECTTARDLNLPLLFSVHFR